MYGLQVKEEGLGAPGKARQKKYTVTDCLLKSRISSLSFFQKRKNGQDHFFGKYYRIEGE